MADILFKCESCQKQLVVDEAGAGLQINCPTCNASLTIPASQPAVEVPTPASPTVKIVPTPSQTPARIGLLGSIVVSMLIVFSALILYIGVDFTYWLTFAVVVAIGATVYRFRKKLLMLQAKTVLLVIGITFLTVIAVIGGWLWSSVTAGKQNELGGKEDGKFATAMKWTTSNGTSGYYTISVAAYESGKVDFSLYRAKTLPPRTDFSFSDLPASRVPEAIAAFDKFIDWEKAAQQNNLSSVHKDFPSPWRLKT